MKTLKKCLSPPCTKISRMALKIKMNPNDYLQNLKEPEHNVSKECEIIMEQHNGTPLELYHKLFAVTNDIRQAIKIVCHEFFDDYMETQYDEKTPYYYELLSEYGNYNSMEGCYAEVEEIIKWYAMVTIEYYVEMDGDEDDEGVAEDIE